MSEPLSPEEFQTEVLRRLEGLDDRLRQVEDAAGSAYSSASAVESEMGSIRPELREVHAWVSWLCEQFETDDESPA